VQTSNQTDASTSLSSNLSEAVMLAASSGNVVQLDALIGQGVSLSAADSAGRTPLILAAQHDNSASVTRLVAESVPLDSRDNSGETALHHALRGYAYTTAQLIVDAGADTLAEDNFGVTPSDVARDRGIQSLRRIDQDVIDFEENPVGYIMLAAEPKRDCSSPPDSTLENVIVYIDGLRYGRRVPKWYQPKMTQSVKTIPCSPFLERPTMEMYLLIWTDRDW